MSIYAISDLHLFAAGTKPMDIFGGNWAGHFEDIERDWKSRVTENDTVLIGGDISWAMYLSDALADLSRIAALPGKKVIIRGNHDYWWSGISKLREVLPKSMLAVQNDAVRVENVIVAGSRGWTVPDSKQTAEDKKIYDREVLRMELSLSAAKKLQQQGERIAVLMHYPPFNARRTENEFMRLFQTYGVDKVIYGHLHGKDCRTDLYIKIGGIEYYLTACDQTDNRLAEIYP